jgi:hypothetical protein
MTEFDAAFEFVKDYAEAVAVAIRRNERLDDWSAYNRHCRNQGLLPTRERLKLARDIAIAAREYAAGAGAEDGLIVADAATDSRDITNVPRQFLAESLECHGWRADYLNRPADFRRKLGDCNHDSP